MLYTLVYSWADVAFCSFLYHGLCSSVCVLQKNFKDANLRDITRQKVAVRKAGTPDQPKYRDRASERRVLFNQPDTPVPEKDPKDVNKSKKSGGPPPPPSPPPPPPSVNPGQDATNVGNKLLKMMGWTEGTGLGTSGEGRVDPMFVFRHLQDVCHSLDGS